MRIIPIVLDTHYPILGYWWSQLHLPLVPKKYLPPTGRVVIDGEKYVCAAFVYFSDGNVASIGHVVANPDIRGQERSSALDSLIEEMIYLAKEAGYDLISAAVSANLIRMNARYRKFGFTQTDENINMLGRILCP